MKMASRILLLFLPAIGLIIFAGCREESVDTGGIAALQASATSVAVERADSFARSTSTEWFSRTRPVSTLAPTLGGVATIWSANTPAADHDPNATIPPGAVRVDHHSLVLFDLIPEEYIQRASQLRMLFIDRSVGFNIDEGLTCLGYPSNAASPIGCRRAQHKQAVFNVPEQDLAWSRPGGYDRSNWTFQTWPTNGCGSWSEMAQCFIVHVEPMLDRYDVISFQYSYLAVDGGSSIDDVPGGFFSDGRNTTDVYDLEDFQARNPDRVIIYWTTSLARSIGTEESLIFNDQMREYAMENNKILFDVADILSHAPSGESCYDNRDGISYSDGTKSEDYPDDGQDFPAICQHYTTEVNGGHLGGVSAGKIRVAKAFWVLMAQIAGWDPGG